MNDLRAEQALRVLDAIEGETKRVGYLSITLVCTRADNGVSVLSDAASHPGRNLLDALAQYAQGLVMAGEPWGEPGALDAESDVDAFDRATGGVHV